MASGRVRGWRVALDGLRLGAEPGNPNQREAEHLGPDRLDRRGPGWAGFASQPGFGGGLLRRGESRGSVGPKQFGRGFDICQLRGCACDTSRLSNRASPRRDYRCCDCDGNSLFGLVRWGIGPRSRIPGSVAVPELAGCCRALLPGVGPEDLANSKPGHSRVSVSIAVPKPVNVTRSVSVASGCGSVAKALSQTGPEGIPTSASTARRPVRSAGESVGLQLLRARRADPQSALQLLRLLHPLCQHLLDGHQRLCRAMRKRQMEPLGRRIWRMQLQWRRCALALQRSVAVEQHRSHRDNPTHASSRSDRRRPGYCRSARISRADCCDQEDAGRSTRIAGNRR